MAESTVVNEIQALISKLKELEKGCTESFLDLKALNFSVIEGEMKLFNEFNNYFFKVDPKNPKDKKIIHAAKQFCTIIKVPYNFFCKNPEFMRKGLVSCWLPSLKTEKSSILGKFRTTKEVNNFIIRAMLPVEFTNITNSQVIEALAREVLDDYKIDFVIGDERDDLVLHVRLISKDEFEVCGEKCSVGFSVVASELGASPLSVDTLLYRSSSKASFLATYSGESFFSFDYDKIQKTDLQNMFPPLMAHLSENLGLIKTKIQAAKELVQKKENNETLIRSLRSDKRLNDKFHTLLYQEIEKDDTIKTRWDFVNKMSIIAKDFEVGKRLNIERIAGDLLGLFFPKN